MRRNDHHRWVWTAVVSGMALLALGLPARAWAHGGSSSGGASAGAIKDLFTIVLWIAVPIFLLVEGLLVYAIVRYRRRSKEEMPEQVEGNRRLEIAWTVIPFLIVFVLFALTVHALQTDYRVKADGSYGEPDYTVHVSAYMYNWDYEYFIGDGEKTGVVTTKELKIPANRAVLLEISTRDVQHSFWVPDLAGKVDAIPGHPNTMWLDVAKTGQYHGNCAEYCGLNHYAMEIEVQVMDPQDFDAWLSEETAAAAQFKPMGTDMQSVLPPGDEERGEQVFNDLACNACHALDKDQPSGPAVKRMMRDASKIEETTDYTSDQYLRESILMPCTTLAEGYDTCIMPQDYGQKLDAHMLADLVEFLKYEKSGSGGTGE